MFLSRPGVCLYCPSRLATVLDMYLGALDAAPDALLASRGCAQSWGGSKSRGRSSCEARWCGTTPPPEGSSWAAGGARRTRMGGEKMEPRLLHGFGDSLHEAPWGRGDAPAPPAWVEMVVGLRLAARRCSFRMWRLRACRGLRGAFRRACRATKAIRTKFMVDMIRVYSRVERGVGPGGARRECAWLSGFDPGQKQQWCMVGHWSHSLAPRACFGSPRQPEGTCPSSPFRCAAGLAPGVPWARYRGPGNPFRFQAGTRAPNFAAKVRGSFRVCKNSPPKCVKAFAISAFLRFCAAAQCPKRGDPEQNGPHLAALGPGALLLA